MPDAYEFADRRRGPRAVVPAALVDVILGPRLVGARCRGLAPAFDLEVPGESVEQRATRHARALEVCAGCPARAACAAALDGTDLLGVWAGRVVGRPARPAGRAAAS